MQITAVVQGTSALLGTVKLRRYVDIGLAQILEYADGHYVDLDFWITSHTARSIIVQQVIVSAPGPKNSPCAAPAPLITFHFDSIALPEAHPKKSGEEELTAVLRVRQEGSSESQQAYHVAGSYRYDPCGPTIVKVAIPYSFTLDRADQNQPRRIRIELPTAIQIKGSGAVWPDWHNASLRTVLEGGETINATTQTKK